MSPASGAREPESVEPCQNCGEPLAPSDRFCAACGSRRPDPRDHVELELPGVAAVSDRGLRHQQNEDAVVIRRVPADALAGWDDEADAVLAVVCDGVSSGPRPELASAEAARAGADALITALQNAATPEEATRRAIQAAASAVASLAERPDLSGAPACTFVSALCLGDEVTVGWVGDSRAYWLGLPPEPAGEQLTEDDSWQAMAVAQGLMSPERAAADRRAHALVRWLGADAKEVRPRVTSFRPRRPGLALVCTDGLWNYLPTPSALVDALPSGATEDLLSAAQALVRTALRAGGQDNVTVALLPVRPEESVASPAGQGGEESPADQAGEESGS